MRRAKGLCAAFLVTIGVGTLQTADSQSNFYAVRADSAQADRHVGANSDSLIANTDVSFWQGVEPLISSSGVCENLSSEDIPEGAQLNFTSDYSDLAILGSSIGIDWMEEKGLEPFVGTTLEIADKRAPSGYPIFCMLRPLSEVMDLAGRLRPIFFNFETDPSYRHAVMKAVVDVVFEGLEKPLGYNWRSRVLLGASWNTAQLWDFSRQVSTGLGPAPEFLTAAAVDAIAVAALEDSDEYLLGDYEDMEQRFPYLQGNYSRRLTDWKGEFSSIARGSVPRPAATGMAITTDDVAAPLLLAQDQKEEETKGALIRYLIEVHLEDDWTHLPKMLDAATRADNPVSVIHQYIDAHDGDLYRGLEHAFPSFVAYHGSRGFSEFKGRVNPTMWLADAFGDCPDVVVNEVDQSQSRTVEVLPFAARCFILRYEAKHAGWKGDIQIRAKVAGGQAGDDRIDDVFFSGAAIGENNIVKSERDCKSLIDSGDETRCIYIPSTPPSRDDTGVLQTFYNMPLQRESPDDKQWTVFLVSYVPTDARPGGAESRPGVNVELTWSLDAVIGEPGDLADMGDGSPGEFELMDMSTATVDHGSKVGLAPIGTSGKTPDFSWTNIFEGMASPVSDEIMQGAGATMDMMLSIVDDIGDGFGYIVTDPNVLKPGFTGKTDAVIPFVAKDGYIGIPDDGYDGAIEIIENTRDTFYFTAEERFCMVPAEDLPKMIAQNISDICEFGEQVTAKGQGTLAFPPTRRSDTALEPEETETYRGLVKLRMAAINSRFGGALTPISAPSLPGQGGSPPIAGGDDTVVVGDTGPPGSCTVREAGGACDCSCAAKVCLASKQASGTLSPQESSCRLSCGKNWNQCKP
ncbi:MAG: hypothetical protein AAGI14_08225 [Pseudomonadota bacterium]